ncbi:MAG: hypothetical protein A3C07_05170 [Candidatus Sungbacteria bacterium RIFCSPHIGHO2_02_FULL_47_11]|uniref:Uncharacterized protein n=1 Tax=Candidatus Sungbacteria bacterium RIFCSPHIGHO2_02_FULL_47_11 TaxID=1802270 RepID=A0A1G2KNI4_9BACT|nr:MAG: hypothetical protein A3C07_05170 [Candidatus Sungbacteria bacterium RIFCSPHIGHO2_02_FULL_47_11]
MDVETQNEFNKVNRRLTDLDGPNGHVEILQANIDTIQGRLVADRAHNRLTSRNLRYCLIGVGAVIVLVAIAGLFLRSRTEEQVAAVRGDVAAVTKRVTAAENKISVGKFRLDALEGRVRGVRTLVNDTIGRTGALEDTQGVDHNRRLFRLPGFAPCKLNGETLVPAILTPAIKRELRHIVALTNTGWKVAEALGFADETPFRRDGKILPDSDKLNSACATSRAVVVAAHLGISDVPAKGRGITTKFGGLDVNRSVLLYLERAAS